MSGVSYEKEDANTRAVIRAGIALGLATLVASALVLFLFRWLAERETRGDAPPPPMASSMTRSPRLMRPSATAAVSANGIDAAEVLPCLSTVVTTFSGAIPSFLALSSMIRLLAW